MGRKDCGARSRALGRGPLHKQFSLEIRLRIISISRKISNEQQHINHACCFEKILLGLTEASCKWLCLVRVRNWRTFKHLKCHSWFASGMRRRLVTHRLVSKSAQNLHVQEVKLDTFMAVRSG